MCIVGFSQGTIMALYHLTKRQKPCAGLIGYSGMLFNDQEFEKNNLIRGFSGGLAVGKTSGNYRYNLYSGFEDDKYNPNNFANNMKLEFYKI